MLSFRSAWLTGILLCFHKIAQVPGTRQYNLHPRLRDKKDLNAEIKKIYEAGLCKRLLVVEKSPQTILQIFHFVPNLIGLILGCHGGNKKL
jgi:hypothetical protein